MAAALKTVQPQPLPRRKRSRSQPATPAQAAPRSVSPRPMQVVPRSRSGMSGAAVNSPTVRQLPTRKPLPTWLKLLMHLQRGSVIVTFVLMTAALVVYGSTIYMQQRWSKEYNKLKSLQRNERTMIAAGELMKNQLIQQAEQPGSGLVPRTAANTLVVEPQPLRPPVTTTPVLKVEPPKHSAPLGY